MLLIPHSQCSIPKLTNLLGNQTDKHHRQVINLMIQWLNGVEDFHFTTSGSTGKPKKIVHHRDLMTFSAKQTLNYLNIKKDSTVLLCINPAFIGGAMVIVRALVGKLNLLISKASANPLTDIRQSFDFVSLVPMQLKQILEDNDPEQIALLKSCKHILLGGAPVPHSLEMELKNWPNHIWSAYGMTETISHIALKKIAPGNPSLSFETLGDIEISYHQQDLLKLKGTLTNQAWFYTNDHVNILSNNQFQVLGRADSVINSGGIKIQPEHIEYYIEPFLKKMSIETFFIAGLPHEKYGTVVTLLICSSESVDHDQILDDLKQLKGLKPYERPKSVIALPRFEYTASGKINKLETLRKIDGL